MNQNIKLYFDNHSGKNVFHFTTDGQAFFTKEAADAHGPNLERKKKGAGEVVSVTRDEVNEWWKTEKSKLTAELELRVQDCEKVADAASAVARELGMNASPLKIMQANKALRVAQDGLEKAYAELEAITEGDTVVAPDGDKDDGRKAIEPEKTKEATPEEKKAAAQQALDEANAALNEATKVKAELADDATATEKGKATKAINLANAAVAEAQVALDEVSVAV
jgi:hypothetical protein